MSGEIQSGPIITPAAQPIDNQGNVITDALAHQNAEKAARDDKIDATLRAAWERINGTAGLEADFKDNPPMPATLAGGTTLGDRVAAASEWASRPIEERRGVARAGRDIEMLKKSAEGLGFEIKTLADVKTARELLGWDTAADEPTGRDRAPDVDTQRSLEAMKKVAPFAKDHREASDYLNQWADHIQRDPVTGWRHLLEAQGVSVMDLLSAEERASLGGGDHAAGDPAVTAVVKEWGRSKGHGGEVINEIVDAIGQASFATRPGESIMSMLDRAERLVMRDQQRDVRTKTNPRVDRTLERVAGKLYGAKQ